MTLVIVIYDTSPVRAGIGPAKKRHVVIEQTYEQVRRLNLKENEEVLDSWVEVVEVDTAREEKP